MALVRHIAGIPANEEQRCIRCCDVLLKKHATALGMPQPFAPGVSVFRSEDDDGHKQAAFTAELGRDQWANDCAPVEVGLTGL